MPVLSVEHVTVAYQIGKAWRDTIRDISLHIDAAQIYGLVGESGSGKSTLALAIMRYLATNGRVTNGKILLDGENLLEKSAQEMRSIWGAKMSFVPQDPAASLNPAMRIGTQLAEIPRRHFGLSAHEAKQRSIDLLRQVRIADAERIAQMYPHQISGGMQQRILIAMALSMAPRLMILDEPTTSLDVTTEAAVLDLFKELIGQHQTATLYVTHNLGVVAQICQRVAVMYAGEMMEDASVNELFAAPKHPYTISLLNAVPRLGRLTPTITQAETNGNVRDAKGCVFAPRCPLALEKCFETKPPLDAVDSTWSVRCHRWRELASGEIQMPQTEITNSPVQPEMNKPLLELKSVSKRFAVRQSLLDKLRRRTVQHVNAVDNVSLTIGRGQTIGLVGESGSGKTTLARCVVGLVERDSGEIDFLGIDLAPEVRQRPVDTLKHLQMVFQNPDESLNPYLTIGEILQRPLITLLGQDRKTTAARVFELLRSVRLPESYAQRLPEEISGGEKQRVAIARAFATNPDLVVCDEAVSALDVSVEAAILDLLAELKQEQNTSYLFITHDLAVVSNLADVIVVMYLGQLFDIVPREKLLSVPVHPYTEALLSAIPAPDPNTHTERIRLESDIPSPVNLPTGCRFHTRCPRKWGPICEQETPPWQDAGDGHLIRCHFPLDELAAIQAKSVVTASGA
jgi:peptide/nickel transport system ATP-binding protein